MTNFEQSNHRGEKSLIVMGAGKGIFEVLSKIYTNDLFVVKAVVPRCDRKTGRLENSEDLKNLAEEYAIPVIISKDVNGQEFLNNIAVLNPKLIVSWGYGQIFKKNLLNIAPLGTLNFHPGLLPFGRGSGAVVGEIWNSATEIGQVAHFMDEHIDKGRVVDKRSFKITGFEYQDEINAMLATGSADFFVSAIEKVFAGNKGTGVNSFGRYYPKFIEGDDIVNWSEPSEIIVRKIRSRSPYRLGKTFKNPENIDIYIRKVSLSDVSNYYSAVGQVIDRSDKGILVKTGDNAIWVEEISLDGSVFVTPDFYIGTSFTSNWQFELFKLKEQLAELRSELFLRRK